MSGLIKAGDVGTGVWSFPSLPSAVAPAARSAGEIALGQAHDEIARLQAELDHSRERNTHDREAAYAAGEAAGRKAADDGLARRLASLDTALENARCGWDARLTEIEALAVQLSRLALRKAFGDHIDLGDLVARAITWKISDLRDDSVVTIVVSGADFRDEAARDALRARAHVGPTAVVVDQTLPSGACRLDLKLGHIDLNIYALAAEIDAALAELLPAEHHV